MVDEGCRTAILEVSSHSLSLRRVEGIRFRAAVFTNLSQDHLDYHQDMERYFEAKASLFEALSPDSVAVINGDDPWAVQLRPRTLARVLTYGEGQECDVRPASWSSSFSGTTAQLTTPAGQLKLTSSLPGRSNLYNIMAAVTTAIALGTDLAEIGRGIRETPGVPGRFERIATDRAFEVIVDYAHSDDALRNLLAAVRALEPARIITVFGCGGDRDRDKRSRMGQAAATGSDVVLLTSDNPRGEAPEAIAAAAERGVRQVLRERGDLEFEVVLDRREAIRRALNLARPGDAVVIAGKGHEREQIIGDEVLPFDDREVCRELLGIRG
jgi:UDP-N-acetylmuramoyl-L-alanyl-D-glutamate--2,6-diaminopimelate ligase